jgi:hypothetical protein
MICVRICRDDFPTESARMSTEATAVRKAHSWQPAGGQALGVTMFHMLSRLGNRPRRIPRLLRPAYVGLTHILFPQIILFPPNSGPLAEIIDDEWIVRDCCSRSRNYASLRLPNSPAVWEGTDSLPPEGSAGIFAPHKNPHKMRRTTAIWDVNDPPSHNLSH